MRTSFPGIVTADIIEVRFSFSGKIAAINKTLGEKVEQWDWIASLDKKLVQTELDKELADYERARADFDLFNHKFPSGDDTIKFQKQSQQSALNVAVKNVELAKMRLEQADLISPVNGIIIDSTLRVGQNATPAGSSVKIQDSDSLKFEFEVSQSEVEKFLVTQKVLISFFKGAKDDIEAETQVTSYGQRGKFKITANLPATGQVLPGFEGNASIM